MSSTGYVARQSTQYGVPMTAVEPVEGQTLRHSPTTVWLPSLSGLRFGAVIVVFGFHVSVAGVFNSGGVKTLLAWIFGAGAGGVSLFFIISGFVLTWSAQPDEAPARFWWRRFAKIYPNHAATSLVALVAIAVAGAGVSAAVVLPNFLLIHVWIPDQRIFFGLNAVSWFIACEAFFYAVFPALYRWLDRLPSRALWPGTLAIFATTWAIPLAAQHLPGLAKYWVIWILPLSRLPEFVAGMLLARIVQTARWPSLGVAPLVVIAGAAYFASSLLPVDFRYVAATAAPLALLVAALGAADAAAANAVDRAHTSSPANVADAAKDASVDSRATPSRFRWMVRLGEYAFAFFLVHQLALRFVLKVAGPADSELAAMAVVLSAFAVAVLGSWLLHHFVELPAARLLTRARSPA